jgi:hypothetical protein
MPFASDSRSARRDVVEIRAAALADVTGGSPWLALANPMLYMGAAGLAARQIGIPGAATVVGTAMDIMRPIHNGIVDALRPTNPHSAWGEALRTDDAVAQQIFHVHDQLKRVGR